MSDPEDRPVVKAAELMSEETFLKHFNARHTPLAKANKVFPSRERNNEKNLRQYHERVHRTGYEEMRRVNHDHRAVEGEN